MGNLLKSSFYYLLSTIVVSIVPFLLLPILTRYLSQEEYGQVAMFQTLLTAMSAIVGFSVHGAASRKFFDLNVTSKVIRLFNGSCLQILLVSSIFFLFVMVFSKDYISKLISIPSSWVVICLFCVSFSFINEVVLGQWQVRCQVRKYVFFQISQALFNGFLTILLVVFLLKGSNGRIDAQLISFFLFSLLSLICLYRDNLLDFFSWNPKYIREALSFGIPLIPHVLGSFLIVAFDRFVINKELGVAEVGIYMVAVQLGSALKIIFHSFNKTYTPWLFSKLNDNLEKTNLKIVRFTYLYFVVVLLASIVLFFAGSFIVVCIAGDSYSLAGDIIGFLFLGNIFNGMYLMVTNYIFYAKKNSGLSVVTLISGSIHVVLILFLIKSLGLYGAAISYSISSCVMFILAWIYSMKCHRMPWFSHKVIFG